MSYLIALRYDNDDSSPALFEMIPEPADLGIRCSLPGWVQRFEFTFLAQSRIEAYERYNTHLGQRMVIADEKHDKPVVAGRVYEIELDGRQVRYICAGAWKEHTRDYEVLSGASATDTDSLIKTALTNHVTTLNSDQSNVDATGTALGAEYATGNGGTRVDRLIKDLLKWSDSSGNTWDYWTLEPAFSGVTIGQPLPYLKARSTTATINWQVDKADLVGLGLSRHIWELARDIVLYYGATPTATAGSTSSETDLWAAKKKVEEAQMSQTPAEQREDELLAIFEKPVQQQRFVVGSPTIRDGAGAHWPLWELIKRGPGYIRVNDLFPTADLFSLSQDRLNVFFTAAADYDYTSNMLRIVPDLPDSRLDALLFRESNIVEATGEIVSRYPARKRGARS